MKPDICIPREVENVLYRIREAGFEAYVVGGCIRDCLLGLKPTDWDIATNARPENIKSIFEKTVDTGIRHGTVTVMYNNQPCEVTTYRVDGTYVDGRRPSEVYFTNNLKEDLGRRDFTINAMAYSPEEGLIDYFNGKKDLERRVITTVGDPDKRFKEDALRMLRAVRFSAQLNFDPDDEVMASISRNRELIKKISMERIREELTKTLIAVNPMRFGLLHQTGLLQYVIPEFEKCYDVMQNNPYHIYNVAEHSLVAVSVIEKDPVLRWTMLLHDTGKTQTKTTDDNGVDHFYGHHLESEVIARTVLKRLRMDNRSIDRICRLIHHHERQIDDSPISVRKAIKEVGDGLFLDLLKVQEADKRAQNPVLMAGRLEKTGRIREIYQEVKDKGQCTSLKELAVDGDDLAEHGIKKGREMGRLLEKLLDKVIESPELNKKDTLIELALRLKRS